MKVYIDSYGCTFNKADAQIMAGVLVENEIDIVDSIEEADVIIVNRLDNNLKDVKDKVYTRDLYERD